MRIIIEHPTEGLTRMSAVFNIGIQLYARVI